MDGWMDGWMDGCVFIDGWMDVWMDGWMHTQLSLSLSLSLSLLSYVKKQAGRGTHPGDLARRRHRAPHALGSHVPHPTGGGRPAGTDSLHIVKLVIALGRWPFHSTCAR